MNRHCKVTAAPFHIGDAIGVLLFEILCAPFVCSASQWWVIALTFVTTEAQGTRRFHREDELGPQLRKPVEHQSAANEKAGDLSVRLLSFSFESR